MTITDRQRELIEAAGKILTQNGVKGLTTKNLAKEMDFSEAAIYRHFGSKEKIIVAMLEFIAASMDERYTVAMANDESPEKKFKQLFQNKFNFFKSNPHFVVAVFADGLLEESDLINHTILKIMAVKIKHLKPIIEEGQKDGVFTRSVPAEDLIHIVMGGIRLQMYKWRIANFQFDITKKGAEIIDSLLKLIKT
jgi:AcrR family transcriptional regulator